MPSSSSEATRALLNQCARALDTAKGVCDLVASDIKPTDLDECRSEIVAALGAIDGHAYREVHG